MVMSNQGMYKEYNPDLFINIVTFLTIIFLIWLAYRFRDNRIKTCSYLFHYFIFGFLGFLFSALNLIFPDVLKALNVPGLITIILQLFFSGLVILFIIFQIYNEKSTIRHYAFLITGSVFFFILLTPIHEFGNINNPDSTKGMLIVGIVMLFLLLFWMFFVLNYKKNNNNLGTEL